MLSVSPTLLPVVVQVASRRFAVPPECPCCGVVADSELGIALHRRGRTTAAADSARVAYFPDCRHCIEHVARWESAGVVSAGLVVIGIGVGAVAAATSSVLLGVTAAVAAVAIGTAVAASRRSQARLAMHEACSSAGCAIQFLGWSNGVTGFAFESRAYTGKFAELNAEKLVEHPRLRKLLDNYKLARLAVPTPAAAVPAIPPALDVGAWIARISRAPGRVARRSSVQHALDAVHDPHEREQVLQAAAALELAPVVADVERLANATARKRRLDVARGHVHADNLPEELQREVLHQLEELERRS